MGDGGWNLEGLRNWRWGEGGGEREGETDGSRDG